MGMSRTRVPALRKADVMSLKVVHVVFVTALSLLCFGTAGTLLARAAGEGGTGSDLAWGLVSAVSGGLVVFYGGYVLKKLKRTAYL